MNALEQAIRDAIGKGGWKHPYNDAESKEEIYQLAAHYWQDTCMDADFWRALGRARGWRHYTANAKLTPAHKTCTRFCNWKGEWHRFVDWLAEGKSANSFFESLT